MCIMIFILIFLVWNYLDIGGGVHFQGLYSSEGQSM